MADTNWNTVTFFETATVVTVTTCLSAGSDPNARDRWGYTPLHFAAAFSSDPAVINALIKAGAELQAKDYEWGATPLHWASWSSKNPYVITALVNGGADLNAQDEGGSTPLHAAAAHNNNPAIITALLDAGADTNVRDVGKLPKDYAKDNAALKESEAYARL